MSGEGCACGGSCGCGSHSDAEEVFVTREDYILRLEQYLKDLRAEITSVEEELSQLRQTA
jgi:hypothetical protein